MIFSTFTIFMFAEFFMLFSQADAADEIPTFRDPLKYGTGESVSGPPQATLSHSLQKLLEKQKDKKQSGGSSGSRPPPVPKDPKIGSRNHLPESLQLLMEGKKHSIESSRGGIINESRSQFPPSLMILKEKMNTVELKDFNGMSHSRQFQFHEMMKELQPKKQGEGIQKSGQLPDSLQKFVGNKMNTEERNDFAGMTKSNQLRFHEQIKVIDQQKPLPSSLQKFVVNKMNTEERNDFAGMTKSNQLRFHEQIKKLEPSKRFSSSAGSSMPGSVYITAQELPIATRTKLSDSYVLLAAHGSFSSGQQGIIIANSSSYSKSNSRKEMIIKQSDLMHANYDHIFVPPGKYMVAIFIKKELLCVTETFPDGGFHVRGLKDRGCRPLPQWEDQLDVLVQKGQDVRALCHYDRYDGLKAAQESETNGFEGIVPEKYINFAYLKKA